VKRKRSKSARVSYKIGYFEGGTVRGSEHPRNNIYLLISGRRKQNGMPIEVDLTIDEAAAVIQVLGTAILDYTVGKRDLLKPGFLQRDRSRQAVLILKSKMLQQSSSIANHTRW
jgi:hypothetical protein